MSGYDSRTNIESSWAYRELLEMVYLEEFKAVQQHKAQKKYEEQQELEDALNG